MCGFTGEYLFDAEASVDVVALKRRAANLHYRGPDAHGAWCDRRIGLAHARLKLLDPENGAQPMVGAGGAVLAYNGEIYNNTELRAELIARGRRFATRSDTEVLLAAYETWGKQAWERLNGMFAFALFDPRTDTLFVVRDRLGIKPAYYRIGNRGVEFGSEPAAWDNVRSNTAPENPAGILHFLQFAQPAGNRQTLFADLHGLEPGTQLIVDGHGVRVERWFALKPEATAAADPPHVVRARLRHLLHLAVGRQMIADAPVGVFLSGGIDSAVITALLAQMNPRPPETFSVALEGDVDELEAARAVVSRWHCRHHELIVTPAEYFEAMRELIALRNLPAAYPNEVLIYLLARRAAPYVKAVLTGEGADELFGGYTRILTILNLYAEAVRERDQGNPLLIRMLRAEHPQLDFASESRLFAAAYAWFSVSELEQLLNPELCSVLKSAALTDPFSEMLQACAPADANRFHLLLEYMHLPNLLARLDGATMAASLEGRVPYTDRDLVDYVTALPAALKFELNRPDKPLLRQTFEDLLPPDVLRRPKRAFDVALERLFASPAGRRELEALCETTPMLRIFDRTAVRRLISRNMNRGNLHQSWLLLSLSMWQNRNIL